MSPIEPANPALGESLRGFRLELDMTQEDVAIDAGITPGLLSKIERGRTNPTWTTVERIATALDVTLADLGAAVESHG